MSAVASRTDRFAALKDNVFDAVIIGGGVNGACLYDHLCRLGYRVALLDRGDFASGTSQASAMLVWGGLLYLRSFDLATVYKFSRARERMLRDMGDLVSPHLFRYCAVPGAVLARYRVLGALYIYWLLGHFDRRQPTHEPHYPELTLLAERTNSLVYEEAVLNISDSRFVLHRITPHGLPRCVALNYCGVEDGDYHPVEKMWRLRTRDCFGKPEFEIRSRLVFNCAGVWTDKVNSAFAIRSPYKHVFSKGVFIHFRRPLDHLTPLIFETGENGDVISSLPWGPVAMWGPTETAIEDLDEGFVATPDDVRFLLDQRNSFLKEESRKHDIVALRCGVRPLAVKADYRGDVYPLAISRRYRIALDHTRPWISTYGGKLTGSTEFAARVAEKARPFLPPAAASLPEPPPDAVSSIPRTSFPGLEEPLPDAGWCKAHEFCCTLEDYVRRRTNIAQWVPRGGLGRQDENLPELRAVCQTLHDGDARNAAADLARYRAKVADQFDTVLELV